MKIFTVTLIVIIIIFGFSFYSVSFLEQTAFEMMELLEKVEESVQNNDWQTAQINLKTFNKEWERRHFMWAILIEHSEIDNIAISLAYLKSYIQTKTSVESLAEINALFKYLKHIPESEKLTVQNFL